jgi:hypothetical protein
VAGKENEVPENCRTEWPEPQDSDADRRVACWYPLVEGEELREAAKV